MSDFDDYNPTRERGRRPPYNEAAEQAVLSACMMDETALARAERLLEPDSFYREAHRRIFAAMIALQDKGRRADILTIADQLGHDLASVGGKDYLATLIDAVPTAVNVAYHAAIVLEDKRRRVIIERATEAVSLAFDGGKPAEIALALTSALLPLSVDSTKHAGYQRADAWAVLEELERRMRGESGQFYTTGIHSLDEHTYGLKLGEMVLIGAVAKAGKSVLAHQFALHHVRQGHVAGIVSAELQALQVIERMMNSLARVSVSATTRGQLTDAELQRLVMAGSEIQRARLWIDDAATPTWEDVRARAIALKAEHPDLTMIVVDFLQLVRYEMKGKRGDEELKELAYGLKGLAKDLQVIMVVPVQLNYKDIEKRPDKRPELMDLQGSSGPVQAADLTILMYRPAMYFADALNDIDLIVPAGGTRRTPAFVARAFWRGSHMCIANEPADPPPPQTTQATLPL